ncbi:MAG: hypothetical protein M3Y72_23185, partial [Acidobacteriota bacterium]|nr:hypothetical protein [Acidobacteriota bacterium]
MASTITSATRLSPSSASAAGIPWYIWCAVLAITSVAIGANWDISWHMTIGRDTFWTPAHLAIYLCGVLAGLAFGYIILTTSYSNAAPLAESSVHIWGFRAPLGAFIASWGGIAMLTSAPFDNWWHDAYGLDVKIISPPHIVLFIGVYGVLLGTIVLVAGHANRSTGTTRERSKYLLIYGCGISLVMLMTMLMEYTTRIFLHTARPYVIVAALVPIMLTVAARATGVRFAATLVALFYMLFGIGLMLILPLFPAEPKLGPVYQHVTHFIPEPFPMLLIVPALALDLLWGRTKSWGSWKLAAVSSCVFVAALIAVQWPFADLLMTPLARNRFFGTMYFWYG